jgi:peptide/nickel transport system permease protein
MIRYVAKRILWLIPIVIFVSFIVFALMDAAPGTMVDAMLSGSTTEEERAELYAEYDLDKPMIYRYGKYILNLLRGDLGKSDLSDANVWQSYMSKLPNTLLLSLGAFVIGSVISIPLGIIAARHAGKIADNLATTFTLIGISMPSFWLGLLLLLLFSFRLGIFPAGGKTGFLSFVLPAICSGLMFMAMSTRQTRSSMLEVLNSDFLRTARAKGVPEKVVIRKHALGNAWIPILTTMGSSLAVTLAGSAVIESVFAWPGVGRLTVDAVMSRDVNMTCGCVIMTAILYVLLQLIVDLLYAFVDPRIKAQYANYGNKKRRRAA